jgi:hypothetical protein
MAESKHLVNGWDERRISNVVIQIVRNVKSGGTAEDLRGLMRNAVKTQASRSDDLPHSFGTVHRRHTDSLAL